MAYKRQFYPGTTTPAKNRRRYMDPKVKLKKLRDVSMDDVVRIMGHRQPGEDYKSIHPPIEEGKEPNCPIRKLVTPIEGAKHGDRVRYIQFTDSVYFAPISPYQRAWMYLSRYRGIDTGTLSGRQIIEVRERNLEQMAKEFIDNETFDPALTGIRGATVHGHACRLDEHGLMFDGWQRDVWERGRLRQGPGRYPSRQENIRREARCHVRPEEEDHHLQGRRRRHEGRQRGHHVRPQDPQA